MYNLYYGLHVLLLSNFEMTVIKAVKLFFITQFLGYKYHFDQSPWRKVLQLELIKCNTYVHLHGTQLVRN
jgi:hypothetical protein